MRVGGWLNLRGLRLIWVVPVWLAGWSMLVAANCPARDDAAPWGVTWNADGVPGASDRAVEAGFQWARIKLPYDKIYPAGGCTNPTQNSPTPPCWDDPFNNPAWDPPTCPGFSANQRIDAAWGAGRSIVVGLVSPGSVPSAANYYKFAFDAATQFGSLVSTWELIDEPDNPPGIASGTYVTNVLQPGYTGVRDAGNPVWRVLAPSLLNPDSASMNAYLGKSGGVFPSYLTTDANGKWANFVPSAHAYGSFTDAQTLGDNVNGWCAANTPCNTWWLTEFGFDTTNEGGSLNVCGYPKSIDTGTDTVNLMNDCQSGTPRWGRCAKALMYELTDRANYNPPNATCDGTSSLGCAVAFIRLDGSLRNKFCRVERRIIGSCPTTACAGVGGCP